jgi:hypothetical protein
MSIQAQNPVEGWQSACATLVAAGGEIYNLLVSFPSSGAEDESPLVTFDPRSRLGARYDSARDVANTIFPSKTATNSPSRAALFKRYQRVIKRRPPKGWGTYFERFVAFGETEVNQLERVIVALATWKNSYRAALVMHVSSAETDKPRPLGGPCLQYLQFNCPTAATVDLLAVYRNHDFCNKALGNYYGLCRVLRFVCKEGGRTAGVVTCLSAHAYYDTSMTNLKLLSGTT